MSQRGSMALVVVAAAALLAMLTVAVTAVGTLYAAKALTTNAADAAALAAAVATYPPAAAARPADVAERVAAANRANLIICRCPVDPSLRPRTVEVVAGAEVELPIFGIVSVRSVSRAEFDPALWLGL